MEFICSELMSIHISAFWISCDDGLWSRLSTRALLFQMLLMSYSSSPALSFLSSSPPSLLSLSCLIICCYSKFVFPLQPHCILSWMPTNAQYMSNNFTLYAMHMIEAMGASVGRVRFRQQIVIVMTVEYV